MTEVAADGHTKATGAQPVADVDAAVAEWRQGDVAVYDTFLHLADAANPVTAASAQAVSAGASGVLRIGTRCDGLVVLTQTCDVRRGCAERPYVELAPLVRNREDLAKAAWAFERPRYAAVPGIGPDAVADLDRTMTVEKGFLAGLERRPGWTTDEQIQRFATAVGRRYSRFAFPDELAKSIGKLTEKIKSKHGNINSPEGVLLDQVRQIRVSADPSWSAPEISVELAFIVAPGVLPSVGDDATPPEDHLTWLNAKARSSADIAARMQTVTDPTATGWLWNRIADAWASQCTPVAPITEVTIEVIGADEYTIDRYWSSQQLDLDHLSII